MTVTSGRRELLAALGGAAATWPLAARAQQATVAFVSLLADPQLPLSLFRVGLFQVAACSG